MSTEHRSHGLWMLLLCILPVAVFLALAFAGVGLHPSLIWLVLLLCCLAMFYLMAGSCHGEHESVAAPQPARAAPPSDAVRSQVAEVFAAESERVSGDVVVLEGQLQTDPDRAYSRLKAQFADGDRIPLLQEDETGRAAVVLAPRAVLGRQTRDRTPWLNLGLFLATLATTTWAGALHQGINLLDEPSRFAAGLPYSLALMLILAAHELGHYFTARAHGMRVTLPYFIPVPFALGTFGAFIRLKSPAESRRALFDMAVAGPLAGLVFAIPALYFGLQHSQILAEPDAAGMMMHGGANVGSSTLLALVAKAAMGEELLAGHVLQLHPLAFAGWLGLIVTALNLLPIGQLDGGHMADAMFGPRLSGSISMLSIFLLFILGLFVWSGLLVWAFIVYFIAGRKGMPPLNNVSRLSVGRQAVGWSAYGILVAILAPVPHAFFEQLGIHCPYV